MTDSKLVTGIVMQVISLRGFHSESSLSDQKISVKIKIGDRIQQTQFVSGQNLIWNESFFYNSGQMQSEEIKFSIFSEGSYIGSNTTAEKTVPINMIKNAAKRQAKNFEINLEKNGNRVGTLLLNVSNYQSQEIIGAAGIPQLSIAPKFKPVVVPPPKPPVYVKDFSIEKIKTPKLNFYSCMDDETITGWEFFPNRYKTSE